MDEIVGWIAPAATMIAAMMTAANLGARLTGWGFVVFTVGSVAWTIVGFSTGQMNLVASNAFLTVVNAVGIWRWLGRQLAYEEGGKAASAASRRSNSPTLFTASGLSGMPVFDINGAAIGTSVEALMSCDTGEINYVVIASGGVAGIDEQLRAVPRDAVTFRCDKLELALDAGAYENLPPLETGEWPAAA